MNTSILIQLLLRVALFSLVVVWGVIYKPPRKAWFAGMIIGLLIGFISFTSGGSHSAPSRNVMLAVSPNLFILANYNDLWRALFFPPHGILVLFPMFYYSMITGFLFQKSKIYKGIGIFLLVLIPLLYVFGVLLYGAFDG